MTHLPVGIYVFILTEGANHPIGTMAPSGQAKDHSPAMPRQRPGNRGFILTLTNTGSTSCSLSGYPGLGLDDARHKTLPSHTFRDSAYFDLHPDRSLIVLSPGETVSADLANAADGMASTALPATHLEVTPPKAHLRLMVGGPEFGPRLLA